MGKNKPLTGRKKTLQLSGARKLESGSPLSGRGIYAQAATNPASDPQISTESRSSQPEVHDTVEKEEEKGKLADFMKAIHTLGSREDIEPPTETVEDESVMAEQEPSLQSGATSVDEVPTSFWHQVMDSNSNHPYYWSPVTNEVSWTLPDGGVISYQGTPGGDEKGEPLDYFAYYDEGVVIPDRRGKGRGEVAGTTESTKKGGGGGDGEKEAENRNVDIASEGNEQNLEVGEKSPSGEGGGGGGTKRKLESEEAEEGEFQLMPTSTATQSSDGASPPKKMPRGPLPRSVAWGVADDKLRKQRGSPIISSVKQEQQAMRFQVSSLADELSRKLQFLHVSIDGVSDMQILQVEVKTRLSDWVEGGLETKFLLSKLKEASDSLLNYEKEAAPKGWRFHWDSTTCRYQFQHLSTGEISWEYPASAREEEGEETAESGSSTQEEEESAIVQSPPHPSLPPPPPPLHSRPHPQPAKPVFQTGQTTPSRPQTMTSLQAPPVTSPGPTQTMTSSSPVATVTKKPVKSAALPHQVTRALVTPEMKQLAKVAAATAKKGEKQTKDVATPTGAFLEGGEMVPAPMPRAWKYENDALNRRVRREGSIERREDIAEKEISANDVRRKLLSKGSQSRPTMRSSEVDIADLPPPPPPKNDTKKRRVVSTATGNQERGVDVVKEALQALTNETRGIDIFTEPVSPPINRDLGRRAVSMETEAPPTEAPKQPAPPPHSVPGGGEESEAKLRERLIERTKKLRVAVTDKTLTLPDTEPPAQAEGIEESTGLLYPQLDKTTKQNEDQTMITTPGNEPSNQTAHKGTGVVSRGLIKTGFTATKIHVSFDRIEPETGESENVAVVEEENLGGDFGQGRKGEEICNEQNVGTGRKENESREESHPTSITETGVLTEGERGAAKEKMEVPAATEGEREADGEKEEVRGKGGETAAEKTEDEEGEISSGSSTPGPVSESRTVVTPRCYMDREGGARMDAQRSRAGYDSNSPPEYSDRYSKSSSSRRRYSQSRSRSRSRDRYGNSRSSKRRRGDDSDYSDYGGDRYYSDKKSHHTSVYSDFSGSDFSEEDRYSRQRRHDDSDDDFRERSSERRSRRSQNEDERSSSRRHKHRSRSRSRSKESRGSGKHRRGKDKTGSSDKKKKKKEKKEKKHKKERKDENEPPKPPKKVTVGRVGKVSSLRTLSSDNTVTGEGDTPLDKAQAAIAESIDEKQKQEREMQERREESKLLESKMQQHMQQSHGGRSSGGQQQQQQQAQVATGAYPGYPTTVAQGGYYSGLYAGYQYPGYATGTGWNPGQWSGAEYQQYAQSQQQAGTGEQQYGNVGTGERQYGGATSSQQYGGDGRASGNENPAYGGTNASGTGDRVLEETTAPETGPPSDVVKVDKQKNEGEDVSENMEQGHGGSGTGDVGIGIGIGEPEIGNQTTSSDRVGDADGRRSVESVDQQAPTEIQPPPPPPPDVTMSTSSHDNKIVAMPTVSTGNDKQDTTVVSEAPEASGGGEGEREGRGEEEETAECEMEIDSGGSSPVEVIWRRGVLGAAALLLILTGGLSDLLGLIVLGLGVGDELLAWFRTIRNGRQKEDALEKSP